MEQDFFSIACKVENSSEPIKVGQGCQGTNENVIELPHKSQLARKELRRGKRAGWIINLITALDERELSTSNLQMHFVHV